MAFVELDSLELMTVIVRYFPGPSDIFSNNFFQVCSFLQVKKLCESRIRENEDYLAVTVDIYAIQK